MGYNKMSALMTVVVAAAIGVAEGQSTPSCAQKMVPCANYISSSTPRAECCDSLREAVTQQLDCVCTLYNTPGLLSSFGIKLDDVLTLPARCGISIDISACANGTFKFSPPAAERTSPPVPPPGLTRSPLKIVGGITAGVVGLILVSILMVWMKKRMNDQYMIDENVEAFFKNYGSHVPKQYNYSHIKRMTNLFRDKLGQGGYGVVYKGKLLDGQLVAVKLLSETKGNGEEFINEVTSISRTSHVNVVSLLGFCYERNKRALIYEFMSNGSLDKFIYNNGSPNSNCHLDCKTLYQIAVGVARGLEYLHRGCSTRIVHFDIKPHNILLDDDFCPKIADFGLAKLGQRKKSIMSMVGARGTIGYIAPEVYFRNFGGVSHKSDVYSYGMMVLEMVGGRKDMEARKTHSSEIYFPDCIYERLEHNEDLGLDGVTTEEEKETVRKMTIVSLWCIQTNPADRPSMNIVVEMLEGSLQSLQIPPKPILSSSSSCLELDSSPLLPQSSSID